MFYSKSRSNRPPPLSLSQRFASNQQRMEKGSLGERQMGERKPLSSAAFNSRVKRFTRPGCLKKRSPSKNQIKKSLCDLIACDLVGIAKTLKKSNVSCLSLFQKYAGLQKRKAENRKLGFLGYRHSEALFTFSRALAWALSGGGWLQELELGFALWERDLKIIAESLSQSTTLKRLSFANSEFGDHSLQILGRSLQECAQLEILNLSACALTDAVAPLLGIILKAHVCRKAQADWQASLRSSKGINAMTMRPKGLIALDISLNQFSDITTQTICSVLRIGTPLEALNLRGNQLTRLSGKLLLDVMEECAILKFVDLRDNVDNRLMGVLEEGQHLTTFSRMQAPFWMSSPTAKSKRACYKAPLKNSRGVCAWEDAKPCENYNQNRTSKPYGRPQSAPSTLPVKHQPGGHLHRPPLIASESSKRHGDFRKNIPGVRALDVKYAKQLTRRPSTSPDKFQSVAAKRQLLSSCSPSPEFAAWEHDDSNSKENRFPFQMNLANVTSPERNMSDEELPSKESIQTKVVNKFWPEDASVLRPIDMTKADRFRENTDPSNCQQRPRGAKPGPLKSKQLKSQSESVPEVYSKSHAANEDSQSKSGHRRDVRNLSSKMVSPPGVGIQTTEWNSFLKEITQAIFHLQERLDELIGPADPDSLTEQATSQLQVL